MKIAYLDANSVLHLEIKSNMNHNQSIEEIKNNENNVFKAILKHPKTVFYTPKDFAIAFNNEEISELGIIAIKEEN